MQDFEHRKNRSNFVSPWQALQLLLNFNKQNLRGCKLKII